MKTKYLTLAGAIIIATTIMASYATTNDLSVYVCTDRFFAMPESVDPVNLDQVRLLVKANPDRFEPHLMLANALIMAGRLQEALDEFKTVDKLASGVQDPAVLSGLEYDGMYAFALFVVAEKRIQQNSNDLYTLRMLQQAIGMDHGKLQLEGLLSRCYLYAATICLSRGSYNSALHFAEIGKDIAKDEENVDNEEMIEEIILKTSAMRVKTRGSKPPNNASEETSEPAPSADSSSPQG